MMALTFLIQHKTHLVLSVKPTNIFLYFIYLDLQVILLLQVTSSSPYGNVFTSRELASAESLHLVAVIQ